MPAGSCVLPLLHLARVRLGEGYDPTVEFRRRGSRQPEVHFQLNVLSFGQV